MISYGVIGTGKIAETFVRVTRMSPGAPGGPMKLAAVCSRKKETGLAFAQKVLGAQASAVKVYETPEEMAADPQIQAVYIASPNCFHYPQSRLMLENGKHVLCEKPILLEPAQHEELCGLARRRGLIYMEAIMALHQPRLKELKEAVGSIGTIRAAHLDYSQLSSRYAALQQGQIANVFNPAFGTGALEDLGIYCIYFMLELFGEPESFEIHARFLSTGADAMGDALFLYPDRQVSVSYSKIAQSRGVSQILGDEGTVTVGMVSQLLQMKKYDNAGRETEIFGFEKQEALMAREASDFVSYLTQSGTPAISYEEAQARSFQVCCLMKKMRQKAGIHYPFETNA